PTIGYRISDWTVDPPGNEPASCEKVLRLPHSYFCFRPPAEAPDITPRKEHGGEFSFGSFNNLTKVSASTLRLWAAVLHAVPDAILVLKNKALSDSALRAQIEQRFGALGIPTTRLRLRAWESETHSHLAAYQEVDVALDSFPYNGATTSCEALWMGVPVV